MGPNHDWPIDVEHMQQQIGSLRVSGLTGVIHKYILVPTIAPDDRGIPRVISWSFVSRERFLRPEVLKHFEDMEEELTMGKRDKGKRETKKPKKAKS